jgi:signal transduction histidine kinase
MIGQEMSLINLNLNTIDASNRADVENKIAASKDLLGKTITELRNLSKTMTIESIMRKGLYNAIGTEMKRIQQVTGIRIHMFVKDEPPKLDPRKELILFRIIQELLQDIARHASAKNIYFATDVNHKNFMLSISDDGRALEAGIIGEFKIKSTSIQDRARLIEAELYFETIKEKGTVVSIHLPLEN